MMPTKLTIAVAALAALASAQVAGQTKMPNIQERVRIAQERINDGVRLGDLTRGEADRLNRELQEVRRMMKTARQDGVVYDGERRDIRERLQMVERDIDRLRYNKRR